MEKFSCPKTSSSTRAESRRRVGPPCGLPAALLFACCLVAAPAVGQEPSEAGASASATPGPPPSTAASAGERFKAATRLFKEEKFTEALPLFRELSATTSSPNAQLYVGHCLVKLARHAEAYRAFSRALQLAFQQDADKYAATRDAANLELLELGPKVAKLTLSFSEVPPDLALTVDGEPVERAQLGSALVLEPGAHRMEAAAAGKPSLERQISVTAGETQTVGLAFAPSQVTPGPANPGLDRRPPANSGTSSRATLRTLGWVAGGVGVAGFSLFAITGLQAKSLHGRLVDECSSGCSDREHHDDVQRGKSLQTTANVGLVVAAFGLAAGGSLLFLGLRPEEQGKAQLSVDQRGAMLSYGDVF
jgi:hypothetical protein